MARIDAYLARARQLNASDLHIAVGSPPMARILGSLKPAAEKILDEASVEAILLEIIDEKQRKDFTSRQSVDFSYEIPGAGRFRGNIFRQRKGLNGVFRLVPPEIPTIESLGLPAKLKEFIRYPNGLVLITGPSGQGKTCTLAALVRLMNETVIRHIITIEDPIEYVHPRGKCLVNQRELTRHTKSFASALRAALREDPDVIVIGELRDAETVSNAIRAAETGHLVFGTLMTASAHKTIDRIIDSYPASQQSQVRLMFAESLRAILSQKLIRRATGVGMTVATEILIGTPPVANLIREAKTFQLPSILQTGRGHGMHRLEDTLCDLVRGGVVAVEAALEKANDQRTLRDLLGLQDASAARAAGGHAGRQG